MSRAEQLCWTIAGVVLAIVIGYLHAGLERLGDSILNDRDAYEM